MEIYIERRYLMIIYPTLIGEIAKRGITKKDIAASMVITPKTFSKKLNGITPFTWPEAMQLKNTFFSDMSVEELFDTHRSA